MNKEAAIKEIGLKNKTALERLERRLISQNLFTPTYTISSKNGKRERTYSPDDIELMKLHLNGVRTVAVSALDSGESVNNTLRSRSASPNLIRPGIESFTEAIAGVIKAGLLELRPPDRVLTIKELPISRYSALRAQRAGKLKMFKNHTHLGRGWRCRESDFQKFLREVE